MNRSFLVVCIFALGQITGCALPKKDYGAFFAHQPRSILVVPALNDTTEVSAASVYSTTTTRPLAERGYYVFPVLLTEGLLQDLGLAEAGLIHQVPPSRFYELFGADAVLFVTIEDWSNKYIVIQQSTVVEMKFVLTDTRTGTVLWEHTQNFTKSSGDGGGGGLGGLIAMAVKAAVVYAVNEMMEVDYRPLAVQANWMAFSTQGTGLPAGPYHPNHEADKSNYQ